MMDEPAICRDGTTSIKGGINEAQICRGDTTSIKEEIQSYFSTGYLCDFKVICKKTVYNIHKIMLAVACPQLGNFFNQDEQIDLLNLSDFDEFEVKSFLHNLYQLENKSSLLDYSSILESLNVGDGSLHKNVLIKSEKNSVESNSNEQVSFNLIENDQMNNDQHNTINYEINQDSKMKAEEKITLTKNSQNSFTCNLCGELCGTKRKFWYHRKHSCSKCLSPCTYCPLKFMNDRSASQHISKKHPQLENKYRVKSVACKICGKVVSKIKIDYHIARHDHKSDLTKFEKGECSECGWKFYGSKSKSHSCKRMSFMFEDNDSNLICTLCLNQFQTKKDVVKHLQTDHPGHHKSVKKEDGYSCPFPGCEVQYSIRGLVKEHLKSVHYRVKAFSCSVCQEKFDNIVKMKLHEQKVHNIAGKFQCDECGMDFVRESILKKHIYFHHSDERHFLCNYCQKMFKQNSELKRHLFVHEAHLSKYKCDICEKQFRDKSTLKVHMTSHK